MRWSSGDYQIAPIAARSTAMGRWRLTPPGYGGTCLPAGRSVRGSDTPPACHSTPRTPQGESLRGAAFNGAKPSRGRLGRCGGRSEKRLPWLGQAAAPASAPVNAGTVLLTDSDDRYTPPASTHRQICTCLPRAKGSLDRRSKRLSFPHFFLRRKKCGRRRPPPRQGKANSPPQRRNPPRAKGSLNRRFKWFSLVTFFLQKKTTDAPNL